MKKVGKFFNSYFSFKVSYMMVPGCIRGSEFGDIPDDGDYMYEDGGVDGYRDYVNVGPDHPPTGPGWMMNWMSNIARDD